MKSKGWRVYVIHKAGVLWPIKFDPGGWQNEHGNHISKKAAMMATNGLMELQPDDTEFVILEVFGKTPIPSPDKGG